jgi:hypothetical protein
LLILTFLLPFYSKEWLKDGYKYLSLQNLSGTQIGPSAKGNGRAPPFFLIQIPTPGRDINLSTMGFFLTDRIGQIPQNERC